MIAPLAIVCVGNRLVPADAAGSRVHDLLINDSLPEGVDLIDGGLGGLDLLGRIDGRRRVVFVDAVTGFGSPGHVVELTPDQLRPGPTVRYGHGGGLAYLLAVLPQVAAVPPEVMVVGVETSSGPDDDGIETAARLCLDLITRPLLPAQGGRDGAV